MRMLYLVPVLLLAVSSQAALIYSIDINHTDAAGSPVSATESGWSGLDALHTGNGGSVTLDGIAFSYASADGSRHRGAVASPSPDALYGDFIFDDGAGQALIFYFGGAGDLSVGTWQVEVFSWDNDYDPLGAQIVGYRTNTTETEVGTNMLASNTGPAATFTFESDGIAAYDLYVRENNTSNRSRLNAVRLSYVIPEPSSLALLGVAGLAFLLFRKR